MFAAFLGDVGHVDLNMGHDHREYLPLLLLRDVAAVDPDGRFPDSASAQLHQHIVTDLYLGMSMDAAFHTTPCRTRTSNPSVNSCGVHLSY